jgi:hypothetical protein
VGISDRLGKADGNAAQAFSALGPGPIRHSPVGVPVTTFRAEDFHTTHSLTIGDLFKNMPAVYQIPQTEMIADGSDIADAEYA